MIIKIDKIMLPVQTAPAPRERPRSGPAASQSNPCSRASDHEDPSCTFGPYKAYKLRNTWWAM